MVGFQYSDLKLVKELDYNKKVLKILGKGKITSALMINKFTRNGKAAKMPILIPFMKAPLAKKAYDEIIKKSLHPKKLVALVDVTYDNVKTGDCSNGTITLTYVKGGLNAGAIFSANIVKFFQAKLSMLLVVTGMSEITPETEPETVSSSTENENTIEKLGQAFVEANVLSKQIKTAEDKLALINDLQNKLIVLMPKLEEFIFSTEIKKEKNQAKKIKKAAIQLQSNLEEAAAKIKAKNAKKTEASNSNLDALNGGISTKAAQLLKTYQDEIASIDGLADKLKSISQIA
jgi:hypothetical protein